MTGEEPPPRVVVRSTDVPAEVPSSAAPGGPVVPGSPAQAAGDVPGQGGPPPSGPALRDVTPPDGGSEPAAVYARSLARTQLRLALACVVSFLAVVALLTVAMSAVPALGDVHVLGVPLPWLLHAYGFYPVIAAFALVFAVAAARNERRFRALVEDE
jgi:hypothetical protein